MSGLRQGGDTGELRQALSVALLKYENQRLLSVAAAVAIDAILLMHPAPAELVQDVVSSRRLEDLVLLQAAGGVAALQVADKLRSGTQDELASRWDRITMLFRDASEPWNRYLRSIDGMQRSEMLTRIANVDTFIGKLGEEGFTPSEYLRQHPELLSLATDQILVIKVLTAKPETSAADMELLEGAMWHVREILVSHREARP